jgi:hypothetical protein
MQASRPRPNGRATSTMSSRSLCLRSPRSADRSASRVGGCSAAEIRPIRRLRVHRCGANHLRTRRRCRWLRPHRSRLRRGSPQRIHRAVFGLQGLPSDPPTETGLSLVDREPHHMSRRCSTTDTTTNANPGLHESETPHADVPIQSADHDRCRRSVDGARIAHQSTGTGMPAALPRFS